MVYFITGATGNIGSLVVERLISAATLAITGPEALSYAEMTAKISAEIGKPIQFQAISDEDARQQQIAWGAPEPLVEARLSIFRAIRNGHLATVTDTVKRVLGRKPITFDQWVQENIAVFADPVHAV
jgi:(4-alkanoyl-5-oxo-2,5-dihydrofuran-3-yl)methyl phosphate reductase